MFLMRHSVSVRFCESLTIFGNPKHLKTFSFQAVGIGPCSLTPLATHYSSAATSILDFWRFINSFTYSNQL